MTDSGGKAILLRWKRAFIYQGLMVAVLATVALWLLAATVSYRLSFLSYYQAVPFWVLLFISYSAAYPWWKPNEWQVARFLNETEPLLQESAELVLQPGEKLNLLQRLQLQKTEQVLAGLKAPYPLRKQVLKSAVALLVVLLVCALILHFPGSNTTFPTGANRGAIIGSGNPVLPPQVKAANIIIAPPAYTGKPVRRQTQFDLQIEEGGTVEWQVEITGKPPVIQLQFNDGDVQQMLPVRQHQNLFAAQRVIKKSGFYQLKTGDTLSELYKIEVIKDKAPEVVVQAPKPAITVHFGQSSAIPLQVRLSDDYGIRSASVSATVSSGEGEAVKFRQQVLSFNQFVAGRQQYQLFTTLNLKALGMEPGNELYFFIIAIDNHQQETRSDVHIITLEDTTVESGMDGMINGLDVKPDLFRSERQIIIETEQLLQDRSKISVEAFQQKSNDLGVDQKLLRLRYGKFLGEETDTEIGGHQHQEETGSAIDGATEILEQYGHSHDNAEDATFFDAATKKQLKETLAEMWKAELQLRTFKPKEALVFEYKALRLLKDLQQKSRAYVAKTGFTPTPLKMEKRLTGELAKIVQPAVRQQFEKPTLPEQAARQAISELEEMTATGTLQPKQVTVLQQAFQQLSNKAAQVPATYLPALSAFQKVLNNRFRLRDIQAAQKGLQQMLTPPAGLPAAAAIISSKNLSTRYFNYLNGGSIRR